MKKSLCKPKIFAIKTQYNSRFTNSRIVSFVSHFIPKADKGLLKGKNTIKSDYKVGPNPFFKWFVAELFESMNTTLKRTQNIHLIVSWMQFWWKLFCVIHSIAKWLNWKHNWRHMRVKLFSSDERLFAEDINSWLLITNVSLKISFFFIVSHIHWSLFGALILCLA